jgi:predicted Zn-dependent protease
MRGLKFILFLRLTKPLTTDHVLEKKKKQKKKKKIKNIKKIFLFSSVVFLLQRLTKVLLCKFAINTTFYMF